jgi:hypothetical protein
MTPSTTRRSCAPCSATRRWTGSSTPTTSRPGPRWRWRWTSCGVLQGWVDDEQAARWFVTVQRRLDGTRPLDALCGGRFEEVEDAARAWAAAQG